MFAIKTSGKSLTIFTVVCWKKVQQLKIDDKSNKGCRLCLLQVYEN